jgi:hypothetical protein
LDEKWNDDIGLINYKKRGDTGSVCDFDRIEDVALQRAFRSTIRTDIVSRGFDSSVEILPSTLVTNRDCISRT